MDIYSVRQELKTKSIYDLPLRVTFYARVSTDSDDQLNSLENQQKHYEELIGGNKNWTFVPGYIDRGLSGSSTKKRERFNQMIDDARSGLFDFIITKELSRFARNTLDSIRYTREPLSCGVCVLFENDSINTIDDDSELRLTIMAGIAQDELRKLSSRVKFGHQQAIKNGVVLGNSRMFGYIKKDGRLMIDEDEAPMVRELFELYATDRYSLKQLEDIFYEKGYRNHNGRKIAHTTLSNTLSNPKYKGYYVGNKVKVIDLFTKKQKFLPPDQWVMYKDETGETVPAIVPEDLWERANEVLLRRSTDVKARQNKCNHANLLTGKLYCSHCGAYYYRKDSLYKGKRSSRWVCSGKLKNGADYCESFALVESDVEALIMDVFTESYKDADRYIDEFIELYRTTLRDDPASDVGAVQDELDAIARKKEKLLEYNASGKISDDDFLSLYKRCEEDRAAAEERLGEVAQRRKDMEAAEKELRSIRRQLKQAVADVEHNASVSPSFVNKYIRQIIVTPVDHTRMNIDIQLFTGEYLNKALVRTGHTRKKICPERISFITRENRHAIGHKTTYEISCCIVM